MTRESGASVELGTPAAPVRDGYTVVDLPIAFEKVDLRGRVAFDADGQVAGMSVLPPDAR